ncbi:MAG: type I 3-dehydroquinate dehydratase [Candidatus Nitrosotenuis sp.]|uniref:3-dehydroquinate dehydratase n=1 Tax=Candidatus Nitrosotenuis uzonensis TaxID=1407055 RepID=A0A812F309_9ARCH|nr:type I 3-dehydroquinate dehydratase [Candidatus Nitrosotenuis uzonensis]CAE6504417.1 3-dehydroquinate dehydratase [Candidatus Nitrosotenuis uzonensis]
MAFKTCATVAESTPRRVLAVVSDALKKSDYVEIRFDFLKPEKVPEALHLVRRYLGRCVCTLRPKSEGGRFEGSEEERISILKLIAEYGPYLLDVEFSTISKNMRLRNYIRSTGSEILVSWHDFGGTPRHSKLQQMLRKMRKFSRNVKIVTTANTVADTVSVMSLYRQKDVNLIAFAMGSAGQISRILCMQFGSPYTYVSLGRPVAPGQMSLAQVKSMLRPKK